MKANVVSIDLEMLGAQLVNMDSLEQAALFRGMAKELMHWESDYKKQAQFCFVASELKPDEKAELEHALQMMWYKEGDK